MNLKILLPTQILVDEKVAAVTVDAADGSLTLLPRHVDFTAALVPGILSFRPQTAGREEAPEAFVAIDTGILVKCGDEVLVSTRSGVRSVELDKLQQIVEEQFRRLDEREQQARLVLARLESNFVRRFMETR